MSEKPSPRKDYVAGRTVDLEKDVVLDKNGKRIDQGYADRLIEAAHEMDPGDDD